MKINNPASTPWGRPNKGTDPVVSAMPRSRRSQVRAWNRPVHRGYQQTPRRLGAWLGNATDQPTQLTDALGQVTQIDYDAAGRVRRVLDPRGNALETWEYDDGDRPTKRTDALGQTDTWAYNSAGQLTSQTNRNGQTTTYSYDSAGRLASLTRPEGTQTLTYDSVGRVTQVQDSATNSAVRYDYDLVDRVTRQIHTVGSRVTELRYRYDSLDRLIERRLTSTAPEGNLGPDITTYTWDNDDRLTQVQFQAGSAAPLTTTYTWDNDDRLANKTLANGITVTYTYDAASRLTRLVYRNSTAQVLEDITYTYDAAGQRTARSSTNPLGANDTPLQASYDANNRLTSLTLNPGTPQAKTYTLSYNPAGSLTSKVNTADANDRTTYTWDSQQRLTQVSTPEHTATYQYDLLGRRVQRQITKPGFPPETTHYVYDGLQAVGEIRPQQSSTSLMTGLNLDEMLARVTTLNATNTTQARTYLTDALGSVIAQTQDNQSTLAGYSYSPYGQTQSTGNTEGDSVQYTGRENDHNGLYYYRARYYDPVLKRFLSEDPIGLAGGSLSFYTYVEGNPVSLRDPLGLMGFGSPGSGTCSCPTPPPAPPGVSCDENIKQARKEGYIWFYKQVRNKGAWDYKQQGSQYQDFGNFNYGAAAGAMGLTLTQALMGAGWAQQQAGTSLPNWGTPFGQSPFGDDPADQLQISKGYEYYRCNCWAGAGLRR